MPRDSIQMEVISFDELESLPARQSGYYEIYRNCDLPLKCGISVDIRKRLKDHRSSRDSGLKWRPGCDGSDPKDLRSKRSILAKHLYFDQELEPTLDFSRQEVRQEFLRHTCYVRYSLMPRDKAKLLEKLREEQFRYYRRVKVRKA